MPPSSIVAHIRPADDKVAVISQVVEGYVDACGRGSCHMRCPILHVADADWSLPYSLGHKALWTTWYANIGIPPAQARQDQGWDQELLCAHLIRGCSDPRQDAS